MLCYSPTRPVVWRVGLLPASPWGLRGGHALKQVKWPVQVLGARGHCTSLSVFYMEARVGGFSADVAQPWPSASL